MAGVVCLLFRFEARTSGATESHSRDAGQREARESRHSNDGRRERKIGPNQIAAGLSFQQQQQTALQRTSQM